MKEDSKSTSRRGSILWKISKAMETPKIPLETQIRKEINKLKNNPEESYKARMRALIASIKTC